MPSTLTLSDLDGLPGLVTAHIAGSRTAALKLVRAGKTVTASGPHGAINIWRDNSARLHAEFYRWRVSQSHITVRTVADLNLWLKAWWPSLKAERLPSKHHR